MHVMLSRFVAVVHTASWSGGGGAARRSFALPAFVLALGLPWILPASGAAAPHDLFDGPSFGELAAEQLEEAFRSASRMTARKAELAAYIATARRAYFAAYPDGPDLEAAARAFDEALLTKDLYHLNIALPAGMDAPQAQLVLGLGGQVDGGIPDRAMPAFRELVAAMRRDFGAKGEDDLVFIPSRAGFVESLRRNGDLWSAYAIQRTYDEYVAAGEPLPGLEDPQTFALVMLQVHGRTKASSALGDYRALREAVGEDVLHDVARRASALPMDSQGRVIDASAVGVVLFDGDVVPDSAPLEEGQIPVLGRTPLDVMKALWRRESPRADALLAMARLEWPDLTSAWEDYQKIEAAVGYPGSLTVVALTLARPSPQEWEEAIADYRVLTKYVDEDVMGDTAVAFAAVPKLRYGRVGDLSPLGLLTPEEAVAAGMTELTSFKTPDGRGVAFDLRPASILRAVWFRENPRVYALLTTADAHDCSLERAEVMLEGMAAAVGPDVANEVWQSLHMGPRSAARSDSHEWQRVKETFLRAGDVRSDIRFFITSETGAVDPAAIDAKYQELAALAGEEALLAAGAELDAVGWNLEKAGAPGDNVFGALEHKLAGGGTSSASYAQWADYGPASTVTFDVVTVEPSARGLREARGTIQFTLLHVDPREASVVAEQKVQKGFFANLRAGGPYPRIRSGNCPRCAGECSDLPYLPYAGHARDLEPKIVRETSEEAIEAMDRTFRCRRELRYSDERNAEGTPLRRLETWSHDEVPGRIVKVDYEMADGSRVTCTLASFVRVDGVTYDDEDARLTGGSEGVETLRKLADGNAGQAAARTANFVLAKLIVAGEIPGEPSEAMALFVRGGGGEFASIWSRVNAGIESARCCYNLNPHAQVAADVRECGRPSAAWFRLERQGRFSHSAYERRRHSYLPYCSEHLEAQKKHFAKGGPNERFFEILDDEAAKRRLWEEDL